MPDYYNQFHIKYFRLEYLFNYIHFQQPTTWSNIFFAQTKCKRNMIFFLVKSKLTIVKTGAKGRFCRNTYTYIGTTFSRCGPQIELKGNDVQNTCPILGRYLHWPFCQYPGKQKLSVSFKLQTFHIPTESLTTQMIASRQ